MACIYKINGKTFNTTEEIQNYVSSDEFVSVLAKGNLGISKEIRNLILNKDEKTTNEVREVEDGQREKGNEGKQSKGKNDGQKTNDVQNEEVTEGGVKAPQVTKGSVGVGGDNSALKNVESTAKALDESANGEMISIDYGGKKVTNIPTKVNGVDAMYRSASETEVNEILNNNGTTGTFWAEEPIEYQGYGEYLIITNKTTQNETSRISKKSDPLIIIDKRTNKKILNNAGNSSTKKLAEAYHKAKADGSNPELVKAVEQSLKETPQAETSKPKPENVKAIEEAITKKSGTIKNEIIKEAADPTEVKKILDNLDSIKSKLAGLTTKDGDSVFSEECKWG